MFPAILTKACTSPYRTNVHFRSLLLFKVNCIRPFHIEMRLQFVLRDKQQRIANDWHSNAAKTGKFSVPRIWRVVSSLSVLDFILLSIDSSDISISQLKVPTAARKPWATCPFHFSRSTWSENAYSNLFQLQRIQLGYTLGMVLRYQGRCFNWSL